MSHIFIELYKYKPAWHELSLPDRERVRTDVLNALASLETKGLETIAWGRNDADTDQRAPFDFFCVYRTPSSDFTRNFEQRIRASGWHDLFEQVGISGLQQTPADILSLNVTWSVFE
jgi:hypothetical protein